MNPGWVYPCTPDDIDDVLSRVDKADVAGLVKVGLVPSTRKKNSTNGRYTGDLNGGEITIYSYPDSLDHSFRTKGKLPSLSHWYYCELSYGMHLELEGRRLRCKWSPEDLRRFMSRHVLLHEIGHHVDHMHRMRRGLKSDLGTGKSETFAEHYAYRG